ncbi:hypothetical protein MHYP_G00168140 [Metynnis hypsauchen]
MREQSGDSQRKRCCSVKSERKRCSELLTLLCAAETMNGAAAGLWLDLVNKPTAGQPAARVTTQPILNGQEEDRVGVRS